MPITPDSLLARLPAGGLFRRPGLPWRVSPEPLRLPAPLLRQLAGLGHVLARFQDASHELYLNSASGREYPWLAPMLDAGKPAWLVEAQRSRAHRWSMPRILRPDLLWCEDGFALSELDSVPGGLGLTLFLSRAYAEAGFRILGGAGGMAEGFRAAHLGGVDIAVSDESADYRPEMEYFADALGEGYTCLRAEELSPGDRRPLYRFFELFDHGAVPAARELIAASARGGLAMSPPPVQHLEEKAWLALLHMPGLQPYWKRQLRAAQLDRLRALVPHGWIPDPTPLPPQAALPWLNLGSWDEVAALGQASRRLVLKLSGFDALAWGARGVYIGHDMPADEWKQRLATALADYPHRLWLMQEFREACLIEHPYYREDGSLATMSGRVRLCPYYFRSGGRTELGGCLATIVPADKKKIHGMGEAILVPCLAG